MTPLFVVLLFVLVVNCSGRRYGNDRFGMDSNSLLDSFQQVNADNCEGGAANYVINIGLNYGLWEKFTPVARKTGNMMSAYLTQNKCSVNGLTDQFYYNEIVSNINGREGLFASSITLAPGVHPRRYLFAPYAYKQHGYIQLIDIGDGYDYTTPNTPYWDIPSMRKYDDVPTSKTRMQRKGAKRQFTDILPVATRAQGRWTPPYFDCGGGNVWLTTHTSPILCRNCDTGRNRFQGVAYIDINLSNKDINQCGYDDFIVTSPDAFNDIFRGTDKCQKTTRCRPKSGVGFRRGGYECVCKKGYYFPGKHGYKKAFNGEAIEREFSRHGDLSRFNCLPCKPGCNECDDGHSCRHNSLFKGYGWNSEHNANEPYVGK